MGFDDAWVSRRLNIIATLNNELSYIDRILAVCDDHVNNRGQHTKSHLANILIDSTRYSFFALKNEYHEMIAEIRKEVGGL